MKLTVSDANLAKFLSVDDFDLSRFDYLNGGETKKNRITFQFCPLK